MTDKLQSSLIPTRCGRQIGHLQLNKPKALNALDLDMAMAMQQQLNAWRTDDSVLMVVISGSGPKAFCAGGDIVSMYQAMQSAADQIPAFIAEFLPLNTVLITPFIPTINRLLPGAKGL